MHPPKPGKPEGINAPGLNWRPRASDWVAVWLARADITKRGYSLKAARLWTPPAQWREPTPDEWNAIASGAQRLQAQMLAWSNRGDAQKWDPAIVYDGSLDSLCRVYFDDPDSPFQGLRYLVKKSYRSKLKALRNAVGTTRVPELTFRNFKRWHEDFCKPAITGGPLRKPRGHALMTQLRLVLAFGMLLKLPGCADAKAILDGMEFENPKKRVEFITAAQAIALRHKAHEMGYPSIALAQAIMFEAGIRQKDCIGEWLPLSEPGLSDVAYGGRKWMFGLHWNEADADLIVTHRLSKSLRGRDAVLDPNTGKLERFPLMAYAMVVEELQRSPRREGPMIVSEKTGRPWTQGEFGLHWRKIARAAGISDNVQNRDSRAGAITEGRISGATLENMRIVAGHTQIATTAGYDKQDLATRSNVAQLRTKNRSQTA